MSYKFKQNFFSQIHNWISKRTGESCINDVLLKISIYFELQELPKDFLQLVNMHFMLSNKIGWHYKCIYNNSKYDNYLNEINNTVVSIRNWMTQIKEYVSENDAMLNVLPIIYESIINLYLSIESIEKLKHRKKSISKLRENKKRLEEIRDRIDEKLK